eukprot:gene6757-10922_t
MSSTRTPEEQEAYNKKMNEFIMNAEETCGRCRQTVTRRDPKCPSCHLDNVFYSGPREGEKTDDVDDDFNIDDLSLSDLELDIETPKENLICSNCGIPALKNDQQSCLQCNHVFKKE